MERNFSKYSLFINKSIILLFLSMLFACTEQGNVEQVKLKNKFEYATVLGGFVKPELEEGNQWDIKVKAVRHVTSVNGATSTEAVECTKKDGVPESLNPKDKNIVYLKISSCKNTPIGQFDYITVNGTTRTDKTWLSQPAPTPTPTPSIPNSCEIRTNGGYSCNAVSPTIDSALFVSYNDRINWKNLFVSHAATLPAASSSTNSVAWGIFSDQFMLLLSKVVGPMKADEVRSLINQIATTARVPNITVAEIQTIQTSRASQAGTPSTPITPSDIEKTLTISIIQQATASFAADPDACKANKPCPLFGLLLSKNISMEKGKCTSLEISQQGGNTDDKIYIENIISYTTPPTRTGPKDRCIIYKNAECAEEDNISDPPVITGKSVLEKTPEKRKLKFFIKYHESANFSPDNPPTCTLNLYSSNTNRLSASSDVTEKIIDSKIKVSGQPGVPNKIFIGVDRSGNKNTTATPAYNKQCLPLFVFVTDETDSSIASINPYLNGNFSPIGSPERYFIDPTCTTGITGGQVKAAEGQYTIIYYLVDANDNNNEPKLTMTYDVLDPVTGRAKIPTPTPSTKTTLETDSSHDPLKVLKMPLKLTLPYDTTTAVGESAYEINSSFTLTPDTSVPTGVIFKHGTTFPVNFNNGVDGFYNANGQPAVTGVIENNKFNAFKDEIKFKSTQVTNGSTSRQLAALFNTSEDFIITAAPSSYQILADDVIAVTVDKTQFYDDPASASCNSLTFKGAPDSVATVTCSINDANFELCKEDKSAMLATDNKYTLQNNTKFGIRRKSGASGGTVITGNTPIDVTLTCSGLGKYSNIDTSKTVKFVPIPNLLKFFATPPNKFEELSPDCTKTTVVASNAGTVIGNLTQEVEIRGNQNLELSLKEDCSNASPLITASFVAGVATLYSKRPLGNPMLTASMFASFIKNDESKSTPPTTQEVTYSPVPESIVVSPETDVKTSGVISDTGCMSAKILPTYKNPDSNSTYVNGILTITLTNFTRYTDSGCTVPAPSPDVSRPEKDSSYYFKPTLAVKNNTSFGSIVATYKQTPTATAVTGIFDQVPILYASQIELVFAGGVNAQTLSGDDTVQVTIQVKAGHTAVSGLIDVDNRFPLVFDLQIKEKVGNADIKVTNNSNEADLTKWAGVQGVTRISLAANQRTFWIKNISGAPADETTGKISVTSAWPFSSNNVIPMAGSSTPFRWAAKVAQPVVVVAPDPAVDPRGGGGSVAPEPLPTVYINDVPVDVYRYRTKDHPPAYLTKIYVYAAPFENIYLGGAIFTWDGSNLHWWRTNHGHYNGERVPPDRQPPKTYFVQGKEESMMQTPPFEGFKVAIPFVWHSRDRGQITLKYTCPGGKEIEKTRFNLWGPQQDWQWDTAACFSGKCWDLDLPCDGLGLNSP